MALNESADSLQNITELQRLRDLGRYYLQRDLVAQALQTYAALLEKFPDDISTLVIVGDSYLMAGDTQAAITVYEMASRADGERKDILQRVELARRTEEPGLSIAGGFPPLHPQAITRLAEQLTGKSTTFDEEQIRRAAQLLENIIHSESPASSVSEHLEEIDTLLPAILELNIRQARSQGRTDLAAELIELQRSLLAEPDADRTQSIASTASKLSISSEKKILHGLLIGEASAFSPLRLKIIKQALEYSGMQIDEHGVESTLHWEGYDLVIAHNPHANPECMKGLAAWAGSKKPVLLDLDTDFRLIPEGSSLSESMGNGNLTDARIFTAALQLADIVTLPSTRAALLFSDAGYQALAVPDGWSDKNSLWMKPAASSAKISIGIFTGPGHVEEIASIRRAVIRIMREFPQSRLVISGDPDIYPLFDSTPDTRRVYLPPTEPEDQPFLLAQADIHLFPGKEDELSLLEGDRKYMEAGVRKITWIASPLPAAEEWNTGGLIARSVDDWYTHMKTLIQDNELRSRMAQDGFEKAQSREAKKMAHIWGSVVQRTIQTTQPKPFMKERE